MVVANAAHGLPTPLAIQRAAADAYADPRNKFDLDGRWVWVAVRGAVACWKHCKKIWRGGKKLWRGAKSVWRNSKIRCGRFPNTGGGECDFSWKGQRKFGIHYHRHNWSGGSWWKRWHYHRRPGTGRHRPAPAVAAVQRRPTLVEAFLTAEVRPLSDDPDAP
ncbi:hypothetical protein ABZ567_20865 [Streptomyces sp. NPDC016459]|uniref:hypothetical protein n=1 Tax=Streptomyces sp. NPDC016459 TaxID=3157190 RepID=UPI0033D5A4CF